MSSLGERIRQLRLQHKLSQQDFAEALGISQSFLSDIERDNKIPGGDTLLSLKRSFHISIDWLLAGELAIHAEGEQGRSAAAAAAGGTVARNRTRILERKTAELEREILMLKGQLAAYREVIETFRK